MKKNKDPKALMCTVLALCTAGIMSGCGDTSSTDSKPAGTKSTTTAATEAVTEEEVSSAEEQQAESSSEAEPVSSLEEEGPSSTEESSEPEESSSAESTAEEAPYDYTGMSGYWYIDGDYNTAYIHIAKDGTFTSYYASGSEECSGTVRHELDPNTNNYIFTLSAEEGGPYLFFADDGETDKTDLYTAGEYSVHYVKLYGEGGLGDDGRGPDETDEEKPGDEYLGTWGCERATIHIYKTNMPVPEKDKFFYIDINWGDSANAYVEWSLVGEYEDGKLICDKNGVKTYVEYVDAVTAPKRTIEYTEGSAVLEIRDGKLYWDDKEENAAEGMEFTK